MIQKTTSRKRAADLSEIAFQRLWQALLTGELKEEDRVREARLAAEWKIGVTPLREAVRRMAALGYLILKPNHAPVVRKLSGDDIREIYAIREVLECFALRRSWKNIPKGDLERLGNLAAKATAAKTKKRKLQAQFVLDAALHQLWVSTEKTPWLAAILERLLTYRPNLMNVLSSHATLVDEAFDEHLQILEALKNRDIDLAVERLGYHIQKAGSVLAQLTDLTDLTGTDTHHVHLRPRDAAHQSENRRQRSSS
jgi:DNA-binding GntR family transcriptional regulator